MMRVATAGDRSPAYRRVARAALCRLLRGSPPGSRGPVFARAARRPAEVRRALGGCVAPVRCPGVAGDRTTPLVADLRPVTVKDWIPSLVAPVALGLSIHNTYARHRDRTPRVDVHTYWVHPSDAPMALRGTANPTAPPGEAIYRCEATNVGIAGVKITRVTIFDPQEPPGKPVPLRLPREERPRKPDNGDSQTRSVSQDTTVVEPIFPPDRSIRVRVIALDTVGNPYEAKDPAPYPYPHMCGELRPRSTTEGRGTSVRRQRSWWRRMFGG